MDGENTYTNCGKDILQFVYQCNKLGVVDTDPVQNLSLGRNILVSGLLTIGQQARPWSMRLVNSLSGI